MKKKSAYRKKYHECFENDEITPEIVGASELYLLSWIDAIERLDVLLLEARYLQMNIINDLREPALLLALKYEEPYLWGEKWEKKLEEEKPKTLAKQWVLLYPDKKTEVNTTELKSAIKKEKIDEKTNIIYRINLLIDRVWNNGSWSQEQRSNYYSLRAIQLLKVEILRDKLELSYHALYISRLHQLNEIGKFSDRNKNHNHARFMLLRGAILYQANTDYVERIRDYQYQFSKTVDTFVDYTVSYNKYRRRDLGVYSDFLRNRTLGIYNEMSHLFNKLNIKKDNKKEKKEPLILHNWMHASTSRLKYYRNTVSKQDVVHITTHYWMPERPDLQPIIAHEIAHKFIKTLFNDITHGKISYLTDDFSRFLRRIYAALDHFSNNPYQVSIDPKAITKELSCDFLAVSIKGIKYVYAQFIELLSSDIGFFASLSRNGKDIDYEHIDQLSYNTLESFYEDRLWYLRIKITLKWMENIQHSESSNLDKEFIHGVSKIVDDILELYKSLAITSEQSKKESFWQELTSHLSVILDDSNKITKPIKKWRKEKSDDIFHKKTGSKNRKPKYPRSVARIDIRARNILYKTQLAMKTKKGRLLYDISNNSDIDKKFEEAYGVKFKNDKNKKENFDKKQRSSSPLYLHIYDIIWQSSLMRAKDLLFKINEKGKLTSDKNHKPSSIINAIHFEFSMGRDLFSFALEFSIFDQDSPHDRLRTIANLLDNEKDNGIKKENLITTNKKINKWSDGGAILKQKKSVKNSIQSIKKTSRGSEGHREHERNVGERIKELFDILSKNKKDIVKNNNILIPLYYFLKTKDKNKDKKYTKSFYNIILEGFCINKETYQLPTEYLVGNISLSASYAQLRNKKDNVENATNNFISQNSLLQNKKDIWKGKGITKDTKNFYIKQLGRYDIMFLNQATSLYRCHLPSFEEKKTDKCYDEKFPSFFARKEKGIPFRLGKSSWNTDFLSSKILVTVRIKLKQRSYRLIFLYRLRRIFSSKDEYGNSHILENMAKNFNVMSIHTENENHIDQEDCAFLVDGVEDIILLFMEDKPNKKECEDETIKKRLDKILAIQNSVYQDFMVDRTRLSFSPNCLKAVRAGNSKYRAIIFIRLLEDRYLSPMNNDYLKDIQRDSNLDIHFYKIPGEYDYYADITDIIKENKKTDIDDIINLLSDSKYVDSINTKILHPEKYDDYLS